MDNRTRMTRIAALLLMAAWLAWPAVGSADDTEIYGSSNAEIKPNVLIIFDNSGSMNDTIHTAHYDP
ncbi:MAG: hypothetical protein HY208_00285, partial [Nitrospirae bacterium]|nr:hypothetical protein [Nitrospirota bacterium]